jgi:hypothetical protein
VFGIGAELAIEAELALPLATPVTDTGEAGEWFTAGTTRDEKELGWRG